MKPYELTEDYHKAIAELSEIEGLDNQCISDTLEGIKGELIDKAKNVAAYFQNLDSDVDELKRAEDRIKKRRIAIENKSKKLKEYLKFNMEISNINTIECPDFKITLGKPSKIVNILDLDSIDKRYLKTTITPDKNRIKNDLKSGVIVDGASMIDGKARLIIK